ncbi:NAD(P)/FAD-dependent oxidoreductase [Halomonas icarae]|uniref:FAD-dependent oxidoreductase n=1 Tax=Halomonas icarae TaxID=2691040 RepID=A0A7X5AM21_9GAMM|nr:FAD-dependent oxidoreductase [Halomonas icarae]MDR5903210.1 FAD-dependent oxidoreductase [Halomonas icarae]NAW14057.1 FAD-dependent oxidoreductase [Halomonas icarae]
MTQPQNHTAIIGAGIAGLACARSLAAAGRPVTLFDKGRGPGGRLSSRHLPQATLDLGAQFLSVRDATFAAAVEEWLEAGCLAEWPTSLWSATDDGWQRHRDDLRRLCGTPCMSALTRHLATGLELHARTRIERLERDSREWWLVDAKGGRHGPFTQVVIAIPSAQARALVAPHDTALAAACAAVIQRPCWTAWVLFDAPLPTLPGVDDDWQAVRLHAPALRFAVRNHLKSGRGDQGEGLTLLANLEWSKARLEDGPETIAEALFNAFQRGLPGDITLPEPSAMGAHRWRYAQPDVFASGEAVNVDYRLARNGLALCGDGWRGPRIEDAWLSGHHLGDALTGGSSAT